MAGSPLGSPNPKHPARLTILRKRLPQIVGFSVLLAATSACGNETTEPSPEGQFVVSPDTIVLTESAPTAGMFLATGDVAGVDWQVSSAPEWITVTPDAGTLSGEITEIQVAGDLDQLNDAITVAAIEIISDIGSGRSTVRGSINISPILELVLDSLHIAGAEDVGIVTVRNAGRSPLGWSASPSESWLTVSPRNGTLPNRGDSVQVEVTVDREPLPVGTVGAFLHFGSNAQGSVTLPIGVDVLPEPEARLSSTQLKYPGGITERSVTITNTGKGELDWTTGLAPTWVSLTPDQGNIDQGEGETVTVTVDRSAAGTGLVTETVVLTTNATEDPSFTVLVSDRLAPDLGLVELDHRVVDAEYDLAADRLVTVSTSPSTLHIMDLDFGASQSVPLPAVPTSVAVQPDGAFAAVGHNAFVSIVDLASLTVTKTMPVTTDVIDIVLPGNGWVYAFPRTDQWETIRSLEIATGSETLSTGRSIRAGTLVRLHPSGDYIYGANNGLSPSDFEKYDIRSGAAVYMYDSPYHGDYAFSGNVWISEDGLRLFARSSNVFRSSDLQAQDMLFGGSLTGTGGLRWAVSSTEQNRIFALPLGATDSLMVYESEYLNHLGTVGLEPFPTLGESVVSHGRFAFVHSDDSRVFVVVQADGSGGLANDWGLIVLEVDSLP